MNIDILNVGHGNCAIIHGNDGTVVMVDCGLNDPEVVQYYLESNNRIDLLYITHCHDDHVSGLPWILDNCEVRTIITNSTVTAEHIKKMHKGVRNMTPGVQQLYELIDQNGPGIVKGETPIAASINIRRFQNAYNQLNIDGNPIVDPNNLSLVICAEYAGFEILFAGDLEKSGWLSLLQNNSFKERLEFVDILVASHHGRESGQCKKVFEYCKPYVIIFSDDKKRSNNHKSDRWYSNQALGIDFKNSNNKSEKRSVFTTGQDGNMTIAVKEGGQFFITTHR